METLYEHAGGWDALYRLPDDQPFRDALKAHVDFGSHVAKQNSNATTDDELHPLREVPKWTW